jgi:hypothetical protein
MVAPCPFCRRILYYNNEKDELFEVREDDQPNGSNSQQSVQYYRDHMSTWQRMRPASHPSSTASRTRNRAPVRRDNREPAPAYRDRYNQIMANVDETRKLIDDEGRQLSRAFFRDHPLRFVDLVDEFQDILLRTEKFKQALDTLFVIQNTRHLGEDAAVQKARELNHILHMYRIERDLIAMKIHYLLYDESPADCMEKLKISLEMKENEYLELERVATRQLVYPEDQYTYLRGQHAAYFKLRVVREYLNMRPHVLDRTVLTKLYVESEKYIPELINGQLVSARRVTDWSADGEPRQRIIKRRRGF